MGAAGGDDLEVGSSVLGPEVAAETIARVVEARYPERAFPRVPGRQASLAGREARVPGR